MKNEDPLFDLRVLNRHLTSERGSDVGDSMPSSEVPVDEGTRALRQAIRAMEPTVPPFDLDARVRDIVRLAQQHSQGARLLPMEIADDHGRRSDSNSTIARRRRSRGGTMNWFGLVGVVATVCMMIFLTWQHQGSVVPRQSVVVSTGAGHMSTIVLPDGSEVQLAPKSSVTYSKAYGDHDRTVELTGEAVFTVVSSADKPFIVQANGVATRVLGTTFGVRAYTADSVVRIAVAQGRVKVDASTVLGIGDVVEVGAGGTVKRLHGVSVTDLLGWTRGRFVYEGVPLSRITRDMEIWYRRSIVIRDPSIGAQVVSAEFENVDVTTALRLITESLGLTYRLNGDTVVLEEK